MKIEQRQKIYDFISVLSQKKSSANLAQKELRELITLGVKVIDLELYIDDVKISWTKETTTKYSKIEFRSKFKLEIFETDYLHSSMIHKINEWSEWSDRVKRYILFALKADFTKWGKKESLPKTQFKFDADYGYWGDGIAVKSKFSGASIWWDKAVKMVREKKDAIRQQKRNEYIAIRYKVYEFIHDNITLEIIKDNINWINYMSFLEHLFKKDFDNDWFTKQDLSKRLELFGKKWEDFEGGE